MTSKTAIPPDTGRLLWLDAMKGISILLIVYFHFFSAYDTGRFPWPLTLARFPSFVSQCAQSSFLSMVGCSVSGCLAVIFQKGPEAVGVFIMLSGFGLTYSLAKTGHPKGGWAGWYRKRVVRLFPMYWAAHVVYLISPFVHRQDPVDYRFLLSFIGDRIYPVQTMFYYINPSWWFFGLLLELYLVFPLIFRLLRTVGSARFLVLSGLITVLSRYMLFGVLDANGNYIQGAFFGARLFEFTAGMVLAQLYRQRPSTVEAGLFSGRTLLAGVLIYTLGAYSYRPGVTLAVNDALIGTGFFIITAHIARWLIRFPHVGWMLSTIGVYSYGLFLLHHPYVLYFGERMRGMSMTAFVLFACVIVSVMTVASLSIESLVNQLTTRLLDRSRVTSAPATPSR